MNSSDMIDYAFGQLDGAAGERAEREIADDPVLAESLDRLGRALHRLLDDGDSFDPPAGLASRTIAFVSENRRRRSILDFVPTKIPFRWADVAVAAGILLASLLTLIPAMRRSKDKMDQAGCAFNLQQLGVSLAQYAAQHGHFPYAPPGYPNAPSGTFAATLHDSNLLHDLSALHCPCNGPHDKTATLPKLGKLAELRSASSDRLRKLLCWDYAYHAGYRHESGKVGAVPAVLTSRVPLVADQPPHDASLILEGNSPNHGRRGQNVLFSDGHSSWYDSRRVSPDDLDVFLNARNQAGPGVNIQDAALVPSLCPFTTGW
ncbi:hypothetical protein ACYOEI_09570 [Singulisphaera rosea]